MKKLLLGILAAATTLTVQAQSLKPARMVKGNTAHELSNVRTDAHSKYMRSNARTTAVGDTLIYGFNFNTDTGVVYTLDARRPIDTGYLFGSNLLGVHGFAERYNVRGTDSTIKVIGMLARMIGSTGLTDTTSRMDFHVWAQSAQTAVPVDSPITRFYHMEGLPGAVLATQSFRRDSLFDDTLRSVFYQIRFSTPTLYLTDSFFVGFDFTNYNFNALNGDTTALFTRREGRRNTPVYYSNTPGDTVLTVKNAVLDSSGTWSETYFDYSGNFLNFYLFPIVIVGPAQGTTSVSGVSHGEFTLFGSYPNPANSNLNIRYGVENATSVKIQIMDLNGRTIRTVDAGRQAAGEHTQQVDVSYLAAGTYVYLVQTGNGDGMASQFTVVK